MTDLDIYQPPAAPEQYQAALAMTPEQAKALDEQVRQCTRAVLREGTDYGVIPGTGEDRKVLLKPGAEKLLQWFGFGFRLDDAQIERDDDNRKQGVTYRCTITKRIGHPERGLLVDVATCEGYAGYDEAKFYKSAEQAQRDAEAKERYWAKQDRRVANPNKWQHLGEYRAPWNTVIKMAQKRAIVGATIDATAAAGLFGQEDDQAPVADDGSTWYEQALETALTFTAIQDGQQLLVEASHAARDGLCTPRQADHVKNRARQRLQTLRTATPADVEDLGRTTDASPAAAAPAGQQAATEPPPSPPAAGEAQPLTDEADSGGVDHHRDRVGVVQAHFKRLGFDPDDRADRLWAAAKLAGTSEIASLNDLDPDELAAVAAALAKCRNRARLETVLAKAGEGGTDG